MPKNRKRVAKTPSEQDTKQSFFQRTINSGAVNLLKFALSQSNKMITNLMLTNDGNLDGI
jgi:hypothetical protein